jgi:uncharacterized protein (TIGR03083 family)
VSGGVENRGTVVIDIGEAYLEVQGRLIEAVEERDADVSAAVAACPGWNVHDVLAHHVGVVVDVAREDLGEFGELSFGILEQWRDSQVQRMRDALTARQVEERRDQDVSALVAEWRTATTALLPLLRGEIPVPATLPPFIGVILVNDLVVHETDIRAALGLPRAAASAALSVALAGFSASLENRIRILGLPALVLVYDGKERRIGEGPVGATLSADRHELVRVLAGRRTREQILGLTWTGDPDPFVGVLSEYGQVTVLGID